jgi:hypothetical protein
MTHERELKKQQQQQQENSDKYLQNATDLHVSKYCIYFISYSHWEFFSISTYDQWFQTFHLNINIWQVIQNVNPFKNLHSTDSKRESL